MTDFENDRTSNFEKLIDFYNTTSELSQEVLTARERDLIDAFRDAFRREVLPRIILNNSNGFELCRSTITPSKKDCLRSPNALTFS